MKTRNTEARKSATAKKTPPAKKSAVKSSPATPGSVLESTTPKVTETKSASASKAKKVQKNDSTSSDDSKPEQSPAEVTDVSADSTAVTPDTKVISAKKPVARRAPVRTKTPASAKGNSVQKSKSAEPLKTNVEEAEEARMEEEEDVMVAEPSNLTVENVSAVNEVTTNEAEEPAVENVREPAVENVREPAVENAREPCVETVGESAVEKEKLTEVGGTSTENTEDTMEQEIPSVTEVVKSMEIETYGEENAKGEKAQEGQESKEEKKPEQSTDGCDIEQQNVESTEREENIMEELHKEDIKLLKENDGDGDAVAGYDEKLDSERHGDEELPENYAGDHTDQTEALEEEHRELSAIAKQRKIKKEREIFVGGLEREVVEEDLRKVFEKIGVIVEIRLHKDPVTNKNKGYAFVEFGKKEQAERALSEMKNPVICGKRCGVAPIEDNDTLFLGNICNTWTKEAIKQKLKDYGIEGVENINLVADAQNEGLSRGFAFLEFSSHVEAMHAYKRLQKPDAIFGHQERTAKVAFAEPLQEPDPEVMAQVKTVFVDGLPPHWDEDHVRERIKGYGEIIKISLARNMSTAKRRDFGFVDFSSHEAAVACADGINNKELDDGNSKIKVKARLSNPLPKTQAVKGEIVGGFRIARGGAAFPKYGRGFGRSGSSFHHGSFQHGRGLYHGGRSQMARTGFQGDLDYSGRQAFGRGGRRGSFRGGNHSASRGAGSSFDRPWYDAPDSGSGSHYPPRRQPYSPEGHFDRPFMGRHFEETYLYGDNMHGLKRPSHMRDFDPDYVEPSRLRPRLDYTDPAAPFHGSRYHDAYGAGSSLYSHDNYGPDYAGGPYSSFYGGDPSYGRGYYH